MRPSPCSAPTAISTTWTGSPRPTGSATISGSDTIEVGATIGVCMDAGKIPWGDKKAAMGLLKEMVDGTPFGKLMGQGTLAVGKKLKAERIPVVKGQAISGV